MTCRLHYAPNARRGFTLVELMVVIIIVSILSALTLSGLGVARQRSKADVTRATIRKINEPIMDQYDSYASRTKGCTPTDLGNIRSIIVEEMPDKWGNVNANTAACATGPGRAYVNYKSAAATRTYEGAECLFMIVTRSGYAPGALEDFRPMEVGDVDGDGMKEFLDAWGNPVEFLRWAPGFSSPAPGNNGVEYSAIQIADATNAHDALDCGLVVSGTLVLSDTTAFQLYPLIYSAGPDKAGNTSAGSSGYGIYQGANHWPMTASALQTNICTRDPSTLIGAPDPADPTAYRDNITNHDFPRR